MFRNGYPKIRNNAGDGKAFLVNFFKKWVTNIVFSESKNIGKVQLTLLLPSLKKVPTSGASLNVILSLRRTVLTSAVKISSLI